MTMTLDETLSELESLGNEKVRVRNQRNGVGDNQYGVQMGDIRKLAKKIKTNEALASELWATGNLEAQLLAILLMNPKNLPPDDVERMVRSVHTNQVVEWLTSYIVKKHPDKESFRVTWMEDNDPWAARAGWALTSDRIAKDAEVAYLLGAALSKETVFSGGALDPRGELDLSAPGVLEAMRGDPDRRFGWLALEEGAAKAALALTASVSAPREILVAGRLAGAPGLLDALTERLDGVAPVSAATGLATGGGTAARGAAVLADGLAGGRYAPLVEGLRLREASGTALDHLRMRGAESIRLA
jgi:hypothetical protein